ncbi:MAG TPA: iron-sulfur cluster assembly scaffold protein [Pyrinomonadaceae bacterium]|nr:iron-sulfur cluster assembly scaffold protein [Pyrinomonadaceae bacterium]
MAFYPEEVDKRFRSPSNSGGDETGPAGKSASFVCGSFVELSVGLDVGHNSIKSAKFRTNGCGYMIAAADVLCDWLDQKTLSAFHGLGDAELTQIVTARLGHIPESRMQCALVVFDALRDAMSRHRAKRIEEFRGEAALICTCFGVSEESIVSAITENGFTQVDQVAETCRAGSGCGSCRLLIQELVDTHLIDGA